MLHLRGMPSFTPYIHTSDYMVTIQNGQLNQQILDIINFPVQSRQIRESAESWAIGKVRGKLKTKYDLFFEITPTLPFDPKKEYGAGDRIIIDFNDWEADKLYLQEDCVIFDNNGYICLQQNTDATFDPSKWQGLGVKNALYYVEYPEPVFSLEIQKQKGAYTAGYYEVGDKVWWDGHIYSCVNNTSLPDGDVLLQYQKYANVPFPNVFPNDKKAGTSQWKDEGAFSIPIGTIPTLTTPEWTLGDNRDNVLVRCIVSLSLWQMHHLISPNNIPKNRETDMIAAFAFLSNLANDTEESDIPKLQPEQGEDFRWGSNIKQRNGY